MAAGAAPRLSAAPARLRRADSFFGLHFDLHVTPDDKALGRDVNPEMVDFLLNRVKPDFVQYDAKGHPGWLAWPSKLGSSAPGIVNDSLKVYRQVTAQHGVALYIHFSGVWDSHALELHPEWAQVDAKGSHSKQETSTFSPYVDQAMIPQLKEAAANYDLDGAWVDGDCWGTQPDYSPAAVAAWKKASGGAPAPKSPKDPKWLDFLEFNRERFRQYVKHWADALHQANPKFQCASNWLYSTYVPEPPTLPVDFVSGDYLGNASISHAGVDARYFGQIGKPWDLMAWGFQSAQSNKVGIVHKPAVQLQQEASVVLAQGGGFQIYYQPDRTGYLEPGHVEVMGKVAEFCRARQKFAHKSESVPQIGIVYSRESLYSTTGRLFGGWNGADDCVRGWLDALVACQYSVDVVPDWKLASVITQYPAMVMPEWTAASDAVHGKLLDYVRNGGTLFLSGAENAQRWAQAGGYKTTAAAGEVAAFVAMGGAMGDFKGKWVDLDPVKTTTLETRRYGLNSEAQGKPAAIEAVIGKGKVVVVPGPLGGIYALTHAAPVRDFVKKLVQPRFRPLVEVDAPPTVEVALRKKDGRTYVHLVNRTNMQVAGDYATVDFVPEVGPIRLKFNGISPRELRVEPDGAELKDGVLSQLHLHSAIAVL